MRLKDLLEFDTVTIQCHDNPDADALGAGFGLYVYLKAHRKNVRFIYGGAHAISKSSLLELVEACKIPIDHIAHMQYFSGLLLSVDCQFGSSNVSKMIGDQYASIDHHCVEGEVPALSKIEENYGSCSTLVWEMLLKEDFSFEKQTMLGTALYFGLYSDTNQFSEIYHKCDRKMHDTIPFSEKLFFKLKNCNMSIKDLETAGVALLRNIYNSNYRYSIMQAGCFDPGMLGIISDFVLQVDVVDACVVYNISDEGFKISVRSCVPEVKANELAKFLCEGIGSGGGHEGKAGGFISLKLYNEKYSTINSESYFGERMNAFFERL